MPRSNLPPDDSHELDGILRRIERLERRPQGTNGNRLRKLDDVIDRPVLDDGDAPIWNGSKFEFAPGGGGGEGETYLASSVSGSVTVDYATAHVQRLTMTGNITSLTFTGAVAGVACGLTLYLVQDGTGGRLVTWPASVKWPRGIAPTLSAVASKVDIVVMESYDGGTSWFANLSGKAYA